MRYTAEPDGQSARDDLFLSYSPFPASSAIVVVLCATVGSTPSTNHRPARHNTWHPEMNI